MGTALFHDFSFLTFSLSLDDLCAATIAVAPVIPGAGAAPEHEHTMSEYTTAVHEAGHAVAAVRFNLGIMFATIVPHKSTLGRVGDFDSDHFRLAEDGVLEADPERGRDVIIYWLAGYIAEVRDCKNFGEIRRARLGACSDFDGAREVLRTLAQTSLKPYFKLTRDFVRREWAAIEAVANALLESNTLDDAEVETIVAIADGEATAQDLERYRQLKNWPTET